MKNNYVILFIISTIFVILFIISINNNAINNHSNDKLYNEKYNKYAEILKNYKIAEMLKYQNVEFLDSNYILILYYKYDCSSCVGICFDIIQNIKIRNSDLRKYIFTDSNFENDSKLFNFYTKKGFIVHQDPNKKIKNKLRNISTPIILLIKNKHIFSVIFPSPILPNKMENNFLKLIE